MHKEIKNYGVDAVSGKDEGSGAAEDTSNYPHIESFINELKPHELDHAMYHAACKSCGDEAHNMMPEDDVEMEDYKKLKE